jgi:HK97 family phage major capsid protein
MYFGTTFVKVAIAKAAAHAQGEIDHLYAAERWGYNDPAVKVLQKAAVGGSTASNTGEIVADPASAAAALEFVDQVRAQSIIGKLENLRKIPPMTPVCATSDGATATWTAEGKASPVSRLAFDRVSLRTLRIATSTVFANGLLQAADPRAEATIRRDLVKAASACADVAFVDPANGGIPGEMPRAVTNGAPTIASTGDLVADLSAAVAAFEGDLESAAWILHPKLAVQVGLKAGAAGIVADIGAGGGMLAGLPAIVSKACPLDTSGGTIALVDAAGICLADEGAEIRVSTQTTVEMDDAPTGDTLAPAAMTKQFVSMFQTDSTALIVVQHINWHLARPQGVVLVTGADYAGA